MRSCSRAPRALILAALLLAVGLLCAPADVGAQIKAAPMFADVPWGSAPATVRATLVAHGYTYKDTAAFGDLDFRGTYRGTPMQVIAAFTPDRKLAKMYVLWATKDEDCRSFYADMKSVLADKYGAPVRVLETYETPYFKGDGYEDQAVRHKKSFVAAVWPWPGFGAWTAPNMALSMTSDLAVLLAYESPAWAVEEVRRTKVLAHDM